MPKSEPSDALKQAEEALEKQELELKTAEAAKKQRDLEEPKSALTKAKEDAEARKSIDQANQASAEAQEKEWSALVPDLSKVTDKPLKKEGDTPLFGPSLARRAAAAAAKGVAADVGKVVSAADRILVTDDAELATSDATYIEVLNGLTGLIKAAEGLIEDIEPAKEEAAKEEPAEAPAPVTRRRGAFIAPAAVVGVAKALASALPGALSLLTPQRTVSTSATTADDFMAAAVVAGELSRKKEGKEPPHVVHDDFRLLPTTGKVQEEVSKLAERRAKLVDLKLDLETKKATKTAEAAQLKEDDKKAEAVAPEAAAADYAAQGAVIDSSLAVIDKFTTTLQAVAAGQKYSPLVAAILRQQLHGGKQDDQGKDTQWFTHVLVVKTEPGSAQQLIDDRALWLKDKFSVVATAAATYMLIETSDGSVCAGGSIGGQAEIQGTFGKDITVGEAKVMKSS
jgi:hypothetical protein